MAEHRRQGGFGEGIQRGFALDDAVAFRQLMLDIYSRRCAITGQVYSGDMTEDGLEVFLLQPLDHGGQLRPANAIVVETAAARLLAQGIIFVSDDFLAYTPHPELAAPDAMDTNLQGRPLSLPDNVALWPDRAMLAYHRSMFRAQ